MTRLTLTLLGGFRATLGHEPMSFATDRARALLAYLAAEADRPHTRLHLAALFWGERGDTAARANLRKSLFRVRQALGDAAADVLTVTRQAVQFHSAAAAIDLQRFEALAGADRQSELAEAASLYGAEFLAGFSVAGAPAFDDWMATRREQLHQQALGLLKRLADLSLARGEHDGARAYANRQLALEPWSETAYRQLMRAHAAAGERTLALSHYERCRAVLAEELGIEPSADTDALAAAIRADAPATARLHHFPPPQRSFVGRDEDMECLVAHLLQPDVSLITLTGTGGIGKTRLAVEAVHRCASQLKLPEAYFVPLSAATTRRDAWQVIGTQLGVRPGRYGLSTDDIVAHLRRRPLLLVLDNYEQLLPDTDVVATILRRASETRLIVTSRVPLNLRAEWRMPLAGLALSVKLPTPGTMPAALELLVTTGRKASPAFEMTTHNRPALDRICRALAGMPLALEMAGSWLSLFTAEQLADQVERNLDFLVATRQDMPDRHRSLRAIFDHALAQLSGAQRARLRQLTVFRNGFDVPAALAVTDTPLPALGVLIDRALLERDGTRFRLHPVLRAFVRDAMPGAADVQARHAAYYLGQVAGATGAEIGRLVGAIRDDIANVRAAWTWAVAHADATLLGNACDGLLAFYEFHGAYAEGRDAFARAAETVAEGSLANRLRLAQSICCRKRGELQTAFRLVEAVVEAEDEATQLAALVALGQMQTSRGAYAAAIETLTRGLALAPPLSAEAAMLWTDLGEVYAYQGEGEKRLAAYQAALQASDAVGDDRLTAQIHASLSTNYTGIGAYDEAEEHLQQALRLAERLGHQEQIARFQQNLGVLYWRRGDLAAAEAAYEQALAKAEALNHKRGIAMCVQSMGVVAKARRDFERALSHYQRALRLVLELEDRPTEAVLLGNIGNLQMDMGRYDRARHYHERAIKIDRSLASRRGVARHQGNLGDSLKFQHRYADAIPYFEAAIRGLRQSKNSYYLCWVLVSYAECLLACDRANEARAAAEEGGRMASEVGRVGYRVRADLVLARLVAAAGDATVLAQVRRWLAAEDEPELKSEIAVTLAQLTEQTEDRATAEKLLSEVYAATGIDRYRLMRELL